MRGTPQSVDTLDFLQSQPSVPKQPPPKTPGPSTTWIRTRYQHTSPPLPIPSGQYSHATITLLTSPRPPKSRRNPIPRLPATRRPFGRYWLHISACRTHAKPRRAPDPFQRRPSDQPTANSLPSRHDAPPFRYASATQLITNFNKRREGRDRLRANPGHPLQLFHRIEGPLCDNRSGFARANAGECREHLE